MADVDVAHIETALAHPANGLMNRTVGGAPTDHRELSALLAEAHLLRCDGVGDAEHLVGAHFRHRLMRSEENTSELQSLMRNSYAVFCLKKTNKIITSRQFQT